MYEGLEPSTFDSPVVGDQCAKPLRQHTKSYNIPLICGYTALAQGGDRLRALRNVDDTK